MRPSDKIYLFAGDSLTEGLYGESYVARISRRLGSGERGLSGQTVNAGRGCDTVRSLLDRIDGPLQDHQPDWLVLAVGANDVWLPWLASRSLGWWLWLRYRQLRWGQRPTEDLDHFAAAYRDLIDKGRQTGARVLACTASPLGERLSSPANRRLARLNGTIKHVAVDHHVPVADVWQTFVQAYASLPKPSGYLPGEWLFVWLNRRRLAGNTPDELAKRRRLHLTFDGIHLNSRGADLWANTILDALALAQATGAARAPAVFRQLGLPCFDLGSVQVCYSPGWEARARDVAHLLALAYGRMATLTGTQPRICLAVLNSVHWRQAGGPAGYPSPSARWEDRWSAVYVPDTYDEAYLWKAHLPETVSAWDAWPEPWSGLGQAARATVVADLVAVREMVTLFLQALQVAPADRALRRMLAAYLTEVVIHSLPGEGYGHLAGVWDYWGQVLAQAHQEEGQMRLQARDLFREYGASLVSSFAGPVPKLTQRAAAALRAGVPALDDTE
jgi:lysophospholipase L1-like esterase